MTSTLPPMSIRNFEVLLPSVLCELFTVLLCVRWLTVKFCEYIMPKNANKLQEQVHVLNHVVATVF